MLTFLEKNFWLSGLLLLGLILLLIAALPGLESKLPQLKPLTTVNESPLELPQLGRIGAWFSTGAVVRVDTGTNALNPFYTLYFQPPPPPPTKKVELLYQGCVVPSTRQPLAFVRLGDALLVLTNGARVVADHAVKDIATSALTLTNAAGQTNVLEFNVKRTLEVPAS